MPLQTKKQTNITTSAIQQEKQSNLKTINCFCQYEDCMYIQVVGYYHLYVNCPCIVASLFVILFVYYVHVHRDLLPMAWLMILGYVKFCSNVCWLWANWKHNTDILQLSNSFILDYYQWTSNFIFALTWTTLTKVSILDFTIIAFVSIWLMWIQSAFNDSH